MIVEDDDDIIGGLGELGNNNHFGE